MFIILKSTPFNTLLSSDLYKHSDNVYSSGDSDWENFTSGAETDQCSWNS